MDEDIDIESNPELALIEVDRLRNSIKHLEQSNVELLAFLGEEYKNDEELLLAVVENKNTIASQTERVEKLLISMSKNVDMEYPASASEEAPAGIHLYS